MSHLFYLRGGNTPSSGGVKSLFAFWMGGATHDASVVVEAEEGTTSGGVAMHLLKSGRKYWNLKPEEPDIEPDIKLVQQSIKTKSVETLTGVLTKVAVPTEPSRSEKNIKRALERAEKVYRDATEDLAKARARERFVALWLEYAAYEAYRQEEEDAIIAILLSS